VSENRVLRRIFIRNRDEVTGGWRKLHNVLFSKHDSNGQVKEDEMGRTRCKHREEEEFIYIGYWWECQVERDHWEDQNVGGWIILRWLLEK
jgi:hypothetical protein